jgi:hypothetical protein
MLLLLPLLLLLLGTPFLDLKLLLLLVLLLMLLLLWGLMGSTPLQMVRWGCSSLQQHKQGRVACWWVCVFEGGGIRVKR